MIDHFFGIPANQLNNEILERYVESSTKELYIGIMPHDNDLLENILTPHRSTKKCYCFGEYLATIELCAHIAEMLAILLNLMTPISINKIQMSPKDEKKIFGREFKKLDQVKRLDILNTFQIVSEEQIKYFQEIKEIRRNHFHLNKQCQVSS